MISILCVDDDPTSLSIQQIILKHNHFCEKTITKTNGQDAIDYYDDLVKTSESPAPDLIFLDLNMPILDGWGFLDQFHSRFYSKFPKTLVYILSSSVDPSDKLRSERYPFVKDFISKPITKEILTQIQKSG